MTHKTDKKNCLKNFVVRGKYLEKSIIRNKYWLKLAESKRNKARKLLFRTQDEKAGFQKNKKKSWIVR